MIVPSEILDDIREHALSVEPGMEVGGRLIVRDVDGVVFEYVPLPNRTTAPGRFLLKSSWPPIPGHHSLVTHSHPRPADAWPSSNDYRWMRRRQAHGHAYELGIYSIERDELKIWTLFGEAGYRGIEVVVGGVRNRRARVVPAR